MGTDYNFKKIDKVNFKYLDEIDLSTLDNISGCYVIWNTENNKYYVGQSINLFSRINEHFNGTKPINYTLAEDYYKSKNKDREHIFKITFVFEKELSKLNDLEIYLISLYSSNNPKFGYNKTSGGGSPEIEKSVEEQNLRILEIKKYKKDLICLNNLFKNGEIGRKEYIDRKIKISEAILVNIKVDSPYEKAIIREGLDEK